jgi:septum formation protein
MQELATEHEFVFDTASADIDEKAIGDREGSPPEALVLLLSHAKAAAIIDKLTSTQQLLEGLLVTCDQVVVHNGKILEKPQDEAEARRFIAGYATAPASTISAIVCIDLATGKTCQGVDVATIHFSPIPQDSIDTLIKEGEVYWCAGGLMVEHPLVEPHVTRLDGALDSVMGLPKELTLKLLNQAANGL